MESLVASQIIFNGLMHASLPLTHPLKVDIDPLMTTNVQAERFHIIHRGHGEDIDDAVISATMEFL